MFLCSLFYMFQNHLRKHFYNSLNTVISRSFNNYPLLNHLTSVQMLCTFTQKNILTLALRASHTKEGGCIIINCIRCNYDITEVYLNRSKETSRRKNE